LTVDYKFFSSLKDEYPDEFFIREGIIKNTHIPPGFRKVIYKYGNS
jgi:hypothetical protein